MKIVNTRDISEDSDVIVNLVFFNDINNYNPYGSTNKLLLFVYQ